jgi:membrane protein YdbS with pleckstrin-like domain
MEIATSPTREKYPLSQKKIIKKTITSTIGWSFLLIFLLFIVFDIGVGIMSTTNQNPTAIIGLLFATLYGFAFLLIVVALLSYLYQRWYFAVYFYDILDDYLVIKKGPIAPKEITIPWERIQDVYVDQDIFDRMFGLFDVHLSTATITSGMQAHIDGAEQQAANGLREVLLEKIRSRISKK